MTPAELERRRRLLDDVQVYTIILYVVSILSLVTALGIGIYLMLHTGNVRNRYDDIESQHVYLGSGIAVVVLGLLLSLGFGVTGFAVNTYRRLELPRVQAALFQLARQADPEADAGW